MRELEDEKSWAYGRMPEYLWIGLILKYYGRDEGLRKSYGIISALHKLTPVLNTLIWTIKALSKNRGFACSKKNR